jgi:hypothetical protein
MENLFENTNEQERIQAHMRKLFEIVKETSFVETVEMKEVKNDTALWIRKALEEIGKIEINTTVRKISYVGYLIELAAIYYEKSDQENYYDTMELAYDSADQFDLIDLREEKRGVIRFLGKRG